MSRSSLRLLAAVLTVLIIIVGVNAFDHLPGDVRARIDSERTALAASQKQVSAAQDQVTREMQSDAALFAAIQSSKAWPGRFSQATASLASAGRDVDELTRLEKSGHHRDRARAESLLADERTLRTNAVSQATATQQEAATWLDRSRHLPQQLQAMEADYKTIHGFDTAPVTAAVQKAETDFPEKKSDLDARLAGFAGVMTQSDKLWQSTAEARQDVTAGKATPQDTGAILSAEDWLHNSAMGLSAKSVELTALTGQLYNSWDKVLVDMQVRGGAYDQKIRTIATHLTDVAAKTGTTSSNEQWFEVPKSTYDAERNDLGMAIEHKPAGKYDSEADRVAQPAGFAYIAPLSQGSNQYGHWEHRDGRDFWVFYGQYALLRDLLFNHDYRPIDHGEYQDYRSTWSRGQTYYGHDGNEGPKYGTAGTATHDRYSGSTFAKSGGFRDSQYASKSGSYRDSRFSSRETAPKSFGHGAPSEPHASPRPSYHPAPSYHPPMRSPGRSFGRRR